tara:strand:+ start:440 stop:1081 length:642 start_codon:yes stop_codon:yes gene_type:complete
MYCGIDEAGRGPVIGPLVMCGLKTHDKDVLENLGVKDSKLLTDAIRRELAPKLKQQCEWYCVTVSPEEIDAAVLGESNLNWLEAEKVAEILNKLQPKQAVVDCPSPNIEAWGDYVKARVQDKTTHILFEHKADLNHPEVSGASIIAKVTRDDAIAKLKEKVGIDFGNGYPSDPKTKIFLEKYWDKHPSLFRKSWAPYKKMVAASKQQNLDTFK